MRLERVVQHIERAASDHLAAYGLTLAQFDIIAHLGHAGGISQRELASRLLVTKGNVSQLLAKLEARGLVARLPAGRAHALHLTEAGQRLYEAAVPAHEAFLAAQFTSLSAAERRALLRLLRRLVHGLEYAAPIWV